LKTHVHSFPFLSRALLIASLVLLAACNAPARGTIPHGTPDYGNGTPAEVPSSANGTAFVRNDQLFLSSNGRYVQVTHFDFSLLPTVFWQTPQWTPDGHTLAFILAAQNPGAGGGGCPAPDYRSGGLYVLNTATQKLERVMFPTLQATLEAEHVDFQTRPPRDHWQAAFWEDSTHLLAWYTADGTAEGEKTVGLYRYDLQSKQLSQVLTLATLGVTSLARPNNDQPALLSVRYRNGQLFYQAVVHASDATSRLAIYQHAINQSSQASTQLWDLGTETSWCGQKQDGVIVAGGPYVFPGWDVSANGKRLVSQTLNGKIAVYTIEDLTTVAIFPQLPTDLSGHDILLAWGPDNQTLALADTQRPLGQTKQNLGPYTTFLALGSTQPEAVSAYTPHLGGEIIWRADSALFVLQDSTATKSGTLLQTTYSYQIGKAQGQVLLNDAHTFSFAMH
jgi:hypothetical protein